ncbi:hypothetical protein [Streptomyces sp. NPDC018347]|uniref:hypothetical protein n=1 Tax=Streptomyces sp. NPDC018347 TaxID=3157193 RepID=UPI0033F0FC44
MRIKSIAVAAAGAVLAGSLGALPAAAARTVAPAAAHRCTQKVAWQNTRTGLSLDAGSGGGKTCDERRNQRLAWAPVSDVSAAAVKKIRVKGTHVALRECPRTSCGVAVRVSNATLRAYCQTDRHTSKVSGNKWWTKVSLLSGSDPAWVSNHYVRGAAPKVPHLKTC